MSRARRTKVNFRAEVDYMVSRAAERRGRIVTLGSLLLFCTESGDAWALDPEERLAACLARDGEAMPVRILETPDMFAIEWTHTYEIRGDSMSVVDGSGNSRTIVGYPVKRSAAPPAFRRGEVPR